MFLRALLLAWAVALVAQAEILPLRVGVGNTPPYSYLEHGKPAGMEVELLREIARLDPGLQFVGLDNFLTARRVVEEMNAGRLDLALGGKTPERGARYHVLEPAIHRVRLRLLSRADEPLRVDSLASLAAHGERSAVLVIPGTTAHTLLLKQTGLVLDAAPVDVEQMLQKLVAGRGRFAFGLESAMQISADRVGLSSRLRWQPLDAGELDIHLLVSRHLPADTLQRLNAAWKKLAASPKLKEVVHRYTGEAIVETP